MIDQLLFTPLQPRQSRLRHFITGWGLQIAIIASVLGFQALFPQVIPTATRYIAVNLIAPTPVPVNHTPQVRMHVKPVVVPPPIHVLQAPIQHHVELPPVEAPVVIAKNDKMPDIANNIPAPKPILNNFGSSAPQTTTKPALKVQTGGFGDPNGVAPDPNAKRPANIAARGSFDLPQGEGHGNGLGGKHGVAGVTASTGFGDGTATGNGGHRVVSVGNSDFDKHVVAENKPTPIATVAANRPAEITYKPKPVYTDEAIRAKVEGVIKLQVTLSTDGKVQILNVLNHLGYGLDEEAMREAQKIKFKPAQANGKDVDATVVVSIIFELAS